MVEIFRKIGIIFLIFVTMLAYTKTTVMGAITEESNNQEIVENTIQDNNDVLLNPGKGLIYYASRLTYDDEHKYFLDWVSQDMLDISNVIYTRYDWSDLQTEEGVFDFSLIEEGIKDCIKCNKKFAFGVMCADVSTDKPYVTPKFVFDKGAKYKMGGTNGKQYIPDWKDETFLKYVNEFTKALGEKYNGNPYIDFIDIRSYGNYGEQHLFGLDCLDESGKKMDEQEYIKQNRVEPEFLKEKYIKPFIEAFPDTQLFIPWGEDAFNGVYEELINEGVSLRRDGIISYTNGLETASKTYGKLPMIFEYASKYEAYKEGREYFNSKLEEAMQMCKPSYIELDKAWYNDGNQEYCKELANKIGYYFRLKKATYPKKIESNTPAQMSFEFKNDGITPICEDCSVYVALLDQNNKLVKKCKTDINPKNWSPDTLSKEVVAVDFENVDSGKYKLAVGLFQNDWDETPTYLLGSEGKTEDNWYVCGDVELEGENKVYDYSEKVMKNPPAITSVADEKNLEDTTVWCTPKTEDGKVNPIYKSYDSNLEPVSWRNSIIGQNSIYSKENMWPQLYSVEFVVNCKEFYINTCTSFRVLVDEGNGYEITNRDGIVQTTSETGTSSDAFTGKWYKIEFNEKNERKIKVELTDCVFNGVRLNNGDEIKAIERPSNLKVLYVGSSITRGGGLPAYYSWPDVASNILNLECINNGVGGTGYLADTKGKNDIYSERLEVLMEQLKLNPDVVVLEAGPNDFWSGYKAQDVIKESEKCIDYIRENSNAKIITIGAYYPSEVVPEDLQEINNQLREQALAKGVPFIDLLNGDTYDETGKKLTVGKEPYITGTGNMGEPKNDGNADQYVLEDRVHLSIEGNRYFGERLSEKIGKILNVKPASKEPVEGKDIVSLYCWDIDDFNLSKLKDEIDYLGVNTLYIQRPANDSQTQRLREVMEFAKRYNLDVFLLEGARDWLTEGDMNKVIDVINEANELNTTLDYKFKGVSLDIEFYLTDEYQEAANNEDTEKQLALFRQFTENTKRCCDYAESLGLKYSMALPVWLDKLSPEILEDLMNYNYDHIAFMNYFKETIMENMDQEVEIAKKHNLKIVSIAEVQDPKFGTVGEEDTFYNDGLDKCISTLNGIKQKYNYENLGISYHYYKPLLSLLERDTEVGIENKYELQIFPYINETNVKVDKAQISEGGNVFEPIYANDETGKKAAIFYGLEYGKQYELKIESGNYSVTKTFVYQKGDKIFNDLEIGIMDVKLEETKPAEDIPTENPPATPGTENPGDKPAEDTPASPGTENPGEDTPNTPGANEPGKDNPTKEPTATPETQTPEVDNPVADIPEVDSPSENTPKVNTPTADTLVATILEENNKLAPYKIPKAGDSNWLQKILITAIALIVILNIILIVKTNKIKKD